MSPGRRVLIAAFVFLIGGIASLPFYRPAPKTPRTPDQDAKAKGSTAESSIVALQIPLTSESQADVNPTADQSSADADKSIPAREISLGIGRLQEKPPALAAEIPPVVASVPEADSANRATHVARRVVNHDSDEPSELDGPKMHRIRDGDTLRKLAQKYLHNADRWSEILEMNLGVLKDPEVLPVGKEIRIPRVGAEPVTTTIQTGTVNALQTQPLTELVPIE